MTTATAAPNTLTPQSPWPGLRSFGEDDRGFFFGRERETAELLTLVQRSGVVIVYGQSGLGKTSLLQAGLFHALREVSLLPFRLRIDHGDAAPTAAAQIKDALIAALDAAGVQGPRPGPNETLWEYFHRRDLDLWGARNRLIKPVIAFDQFEEVFTLGQRSEKAIARVVELVADLESLLEHRAPEAVRARLEQRPDDALKYDFQHEGVKFIISLREDFLAQLDTWRTRMPSLLPNRFRLERLTGAQALEVVERAGGSLVDPAVAKEIVDFVSRSQRRAQAGALQARNVEPALLSVVCDELNRRRLNRNQAQITPDLLSGEREGIIAGFYARAFEDVEPRARDWVEEELLTASGYRDRAAQEDALRSGVRETDLDKLVDRRILHREERDGVVWLELTHDLLTDPAYASHTQREQRQLAEEARRREAETAMRLRRTTRLAAGFAVLSLAMVVAVIYAFTMSKRAADAQASMQREYNRAVGAETAAGAAAARAEQSAAMAKTEAEQASTSFNTAMGMAEPLGQALRDFVHGDMRLLTPAVLEVIGRADDSYKRLESQDATKTADRRAAFLATAAQALRDVGHLTEAAARADEAVTTLDKEVPTDATGRRAIQAEAVYARGAAYAATGRMAQARRDYSEAATLAQAEAKATGATFDLTRIVVLTDLGLGELDRWSLAGSSAESHYQHVLSLLGGTKRQARDADQALADSWRVEALIGLGASISDSAEQDRRFARADETLQRLASADPDNLRLLRLSAEVGLFRANTAGALDRTWLGAQLAEKADEASQHLVQHDRDNLQWKLVAARTSRVVGRLARQRQRWPEAHKAFESGDKLLGDLLKAEPSWRLARYTHATLLWERGETYLEFEQALKQAQPAHVIVLNTILPLIELSKGEYEVGIRRAPGDGEFVRALSLAIGGLANAHLAHADYDDVIQLSTQAIKALAPLERGTRTDENVLSNKRYYLELQGLAWDGEKKWKEAEDTYGRLVDVSGQLATRTRLASDEELLAAAFQHLGNAWWSAGDRVEAAAEYAHASDAVTRALAVAPTDATSLDRGVWVHVNQARLRPPDDFAARLDHLKTASDFAWTGLLQEAWNKRLQEGLGQVNADLNALKAAIGAATPAAAGSAALLARLNPLIADRQIVKLVDWVTRPMMPGAWVNLVDVDKGPSDFSNARLLVMAAYPRLAADQIFAIRMVPLSFRSNGDALYEAGVEMDTGDRGVVAFVTKPRTVNPADSTKPSVIASSGRFVLIDGNTSAVSQMNSESAPLLDTVEHASAYMRFYLGAFHGPLGPYAIVERDADVLWTPDPPTTMRNAVDKQLVPLQLTKQTDGSWHVAGTVMYGDTLRRLTLTVTPTGAIKDDNVTTLVVDVPVHAEYMSDAGVKNVRDIRAVEERALPIYQNQLEETPKDLTLLNRVRGLAERIGRWKDATTAQQTILEVLRADPKTTKEDLASNYNTLSWYLLFVRDFTGALAAAEAGRKLDSANLYLDTNRAHALLFLGRLTDAEAVYRSHLGQKLSPTQSWEAAILQDFDDLEKAGVTSPEEAKIKKIMGGK